jgi:catechol 2,3-dioxygenase-like lactoylglutathione lyase family enzyme
MRRETIVRMDANAPRPVLNQINVIARDWDASLEFYRLLGLELGGGSEWPPSSGARHAAVSMPSGLALEFDNSPMLAIYAADAGHVQGPIVGFTFPTADAVDATFKRLTDAGHSVRQPPYDAFWGARYAIVEDPSGTSVGLMGPIDRTQSYLPNAPAR